MSGQKILIVEDEAIVAEDIASHLQKMGYIVIDIVASGESAIATALKLLPDVILMDIMLQGQIDGIAAAKQIYQQIKKPIVYLTAYGDEDTLQKATFKGSFGYLIKPFHEKELRATIEIALARHHTEIEIQQALTIAKTQSELKSHYLALASHEFRNPLAQIKAWTQLLQRYSTQWTEDQKQKSFQQINHAVEQMNQVLEDLLILGRTELYKPQLNTVTSDLINFCQKVVQLQTLNASPSHQLTFSYQGDCNSVAVDLTLLGYLLNNLLSNAIKYSPDGGEISLSLSYQNSEIIFQIKDCGIGIPEADLQRVFEPFQRASNVENLPGTGLGLVIAKRTTELQGGSIFLESRVGQGTTVTVKFPR